MTTAEAATSLDRRIQEAALKVEQKVIACRRDIHQNPELGNREFRTAKLIAERLKELGIETKTGVAHTGVVGILRGGKPGRVVALRADMDALPVTEEVKVPFAHGREVIPGRGAGRREAKPHLGKLLFWRHSPFALIHGSSCGWCSAKWPMPEACNNRFPIRTLPDSGSWP